MNGESKLARVNTVGGLAPIPIKMRMEIQQVENGFIVSEQYGSAIHVAKNVAEAVELTTKILNKSVEPAGKSA